MFWFYNISLFIASVLGAEHFLLRRFPKTREFIDHLIPLRNFVGAIIFFIGAFELFDILMDRTHFLTRFITASLMILLGYIQGQETLLKVRNALGVDWDMDKLHQRLLRHQENLGLLGLILFIVNILRKLNVF